MTEGDWSFVLFLFCLLASGQGPFLIPYHMSTWQLPHDCFHPRTQDQSLNSSVSDLHVVCLYFLILKFSLADIVHLHDFNYHDNSKINLSTYIALLWFWFFGCDLNVSWTFPLGWPRHFKLNRHKSALMIFSLQIQLISCFPYSLWKVLPFSQFPVLLATSLSTTIPILYHHIKLVLPSKFQIYI